MISLVSIKNSLTNLNKDRINSRTKMIENGINRMNKWGYNLYSFQYDSFINQIKSNIQ